MQYLITSTATAYSKLVAITYHCSQTGLNENAPIRFLNHA